MIRNIQTLRVIAALLVIYAHMDIFLKSLHLLYFGSEGVDLFFVVSGFVMVFTTKNRNQTPLLFIVNRIARVVPLYWVMTFLVFLVAIFWPSILRSTRANLFDLFRSMFFIPFYKSSGLFEPVLFVGWTLNYEMFFYVLFSIGLKMRIYTYGILFSVGVLLALSSFNILFYHSQNVFSFYTNPRILEFGFGMMVGLLLPHGERKFSSVPLSAICIVGIAALAVMIVTPIVAPSVPAVISAGIPALIVVATAVIAEGRGLAIQSPTMLAIGDASYALYLSHPYLTVPAQKLIPRLESWPATVVALAVATVIAALVVAVLLHRFVERPLSTLARRGLMALISGADRLVAA